MTTKETNPKDAIGISKAPLSTVPLNVLAEIGVGMLEGAVKGYRRHNFRVAGVRASVYLDAAVRHLFSWWEGEDIDPDSNMNHIVKALTTLVVLRDAMHNDMWQDDRPPRTKPFYPLLNEGVKLLLDKYKGCDQRPYTAKPLGDDDGTGPR